MTSIAERLLTEDEFLALPDDPEGRKMELYDGRVIYMPPTGEEHGVLAQNINAAMWPFIRQHKLGRTFMDTGFKLRSNPDRVVEPDVAFIETAVLAANPDPAKSVPAAPTLAVEVISPSNRYTEVADNVLEYLAAGSSRVWVVRPTTKTVTVHRPDLTSRTHHEHETLTSDEAGFTVDGFELPVSDIFELD